MTASSPASIPLLEDWQQLLQSWAADGSLSIAAQNALQLEAETTELQELIGQWKDGDFSALPPIELLPAAAMPGAAGAYAISTQTISFFNHGCHWTKTCLTEVSLVASR